MTAHLSSQDLIFPRLQCCFYHGKPNCRDPLDVQFKELRNQKVICSLNPVPQPTTMIAGN